MSKAKVTDRDIAEEYDFSRAKRGVYHERAKRGTRKELVTDGEDEARRKSKPKGKTSD